MNEVDNALQEVNRVERELSQAINQLQPLANNEALKAARTQLENKINQAVQTDGMTQQSVNAYNHAKQEAQSESNTAQTLINNGDATDQEISSETEKSKSKFKNLENAINGLTVNKAPLEIARNNIQYNIIHASSTEGMTPQSAQAYRQKLQEARNEITRINHVLDNHPDVNAIRTNVASAERMKNELIQAKNNLQVDTQPLENAQRNIQSVIDQGSNTDGMTADSVNDFNDALAAAIIEKLKSISYLKIKIRLL